MHEAVRQCNCLLINVKIIPVLLAGILFIGNMPASVHAQPASAVATLSRDKVLIGDTFSLTLSVQCRPNLPITQWPVWTDTLGDFEIRQKSPIDTLQQPDEKGRTVLRQTLSLATFEEGQTTIPALQWQFAGPENGTSSLVETQPLNVWVDTLSVAGQQDILPIKPPIEFPYTWRDYLPWAVAAVVLLLLSGLGFWLWKKRRQKDNNAGTTIPAIPLLPHEAALQKLRTLEKAQYWQRGNPKRYYSDLSDIVREYLENRFNIPAKESVTDEIMTIVQQQKPLPDDLRQNLRQLLSTSDMVKFAKASPTLETHIEMLKQAEQLIRKTAAFDDRSDNKNV